MLRRRDRDLLIPQTSRIALGSFDDQDMSVNKNDDSKVLQDMHSYENYSRILSAGDVCQTCREGDG